MTIGCIRTTRSRQGYNLRCRFKLVIGEEEELVYNDFQTGKFYAKLETPITSNKAQIGSGFMVASNTLNISSVDDLSVIYENAQHGIYAKIYIEQFGKLYMIRDIQREYNKQQLKLKKAKYVEAKYYLNLIESQEDEQ